MMNSRNEMELTFPSLPENEAFARVVIAAFAVQLSPTVNDMADVKTAVSEAVTNAIVHGYESRIGRILMRATIENDHTIAVEVQDWGKGIQDVQQALEPFFTTQPEQERSGMGFAVMQTFMDSVEVESSPGKGTLVRMKKRIRIPVRTEKPASMM